MTHAVRFVVVVLSRAHRRSAGAGADAGVRFATGRGPSRRTLRRIGKMYAIEARVVKLYSSITCIEESV